MILRYTKHRFFTTFSMILCILSLSLVSCKGTEDVEDEEILSEDYDQFQGFSLKEYDIPATIMLPDETANIGTSTKPEIIHPEDGYKWELKVGNNFSIFIEDWGDVDDRIESKKKELKDLTFYDVKYLIDEKDLIMYERNLKVEGNKNAAASVGVSHKSYHVYGQKEINGITYLFQTREEGCEKLIVDFMTRSIKSVKAVK